MVPVPFEAGALVASVEGAVELGAALFGAYYSAEFAEPADWAERALDSLEGD